MRRKFLDLSNLIWRYPKQSFYFHLYQSLEALIFSIVLLSVLIASFSFPLILVPLLNYVSIPTNKKNIFTNYLKNNSSDSTYT